MNHLVLVLSVPGEHGAWNSITIQNITGERFLHGKERSGLREGSSAASFFPQGWNFFPAETDLFSRRTGPSPPQGRSYTTCWLRAPAGASGRGR